MESTTQTIHSRINQAKGSKLLPNSHKNILIARKMWANILGPNNLLKDSCHPSLPFA
jgi:hypothetical protein